MFNKFRPQLLPLVNFVATPFMRIHPNILSLMSFAMAAPGFYFYVKGNSLLGSLFILGALFDSVDGVVARKTDKTSKFGGVLDATLDRIFEGVLLLCIGIGNLVSWNLVMLLYIFSISVSYVKSKAETVLQETSVGTNQLSVGIAQRGERVVIIFLSSILNYFFTPESNSLFNIALLILTLLAAFTLLWRLKVVYNLLR